MEESFLRREARLKDETELLIAQHSERMRALDAEKSDMQTSSARKMAMIQTAKDAEIERLKELHRKVLDEMRREHEEEAAHLRKLKVTVLRIPTELSGFKEPRSPNRISGVAKLFLARGVICVLVTRFHPRIYSMYF